MTLIQNLKTFLRFFPGILFVIHCGFFWYYAPDWSTFILAFLFYIFLNLLKKYPINNLRYFIHEIKLSNNKETVLFFLSVIIHYSLCVIILVFWFLLLYWVQTPVLNFESLMVIILIKINISAKIFGLIFIVLQISLFVQLCLVFYRHVDVISSIKNFLYWISLFIVYIMYHFFLCYTICIYNISLPLDLLYKLGFITNYSFWAVFLLFVFIWGFLRIKFARDWTFNYAYLFLGIFCCLGIFFILISSWVITTYSLEILEQWPNTKLFLFKQ